MTGFERGFQRHITWSLGSCEGANILVCVRLRTLRGVGFHLRTHARSPCARAWRWVPAANCGTAGEPAPAAPRCLPFRPSPSRSTHPSLCPAQAAAAAAAQACRRCYRGQHCRWAGWPYFLMSRQYYYWCPQLGRTVFVGSLPVMNMLLQVAPNNGHNVIGHLAGVSKCRVNDTQHHRLMCCPRNCVTSVCTPLHLHRTPDQECEARYYGTFASLA